jgi:hypothetical protein
MLGARTSRPPSVRSTLIRLVDNFLNRFALRAQCGRAVRAPSIRLSYFARP